MWIAGTGAGTAPAAATGAPHAAPAAAAAARTCTYSPDGRAARRVERPGADVSALRPYTATLKTGGGAIAFAAETGRAPCTTHSFRSLAAQKYFDGTTCHRLTTAGIFVLQCGDPTGTGTGGPGYRFADENLSGATYPAGTVAMANAGPHTNGSQFFLVYKDTRLPPAYTPFGRITAGLDVLRAIAAAGTGNGASDGAPRREVRLTTVTTAPR